LVTVGLPVVSRVIRSARWFGQGVPSDPEKRKIAREAAPLISISGSAAVRSIVWARQRNWTLPEP
jgi:hypothetical protein